MNLILVISFLIVSILYVLIKNIVFPVVKEAGYRIGLSVGGVSILVGLTAGLSIIIIVLPGLKFAWKFAKKIDFVK